MEFSAVRTEMRELNEETHVHMRVLHEDIVSRIALLDEHMNGRSRSRRVPHHRRKKPKR